MCPSSSAGAEVLVPHYVFHWWQTDFMTRKIRKGARGWTQRQEYIPPRGVLQGATLQICSLAAGTGTGTAAAIWSKYLMGTGPLQGIFVAEGPRSKGAFRTAVSRKWRCWTKVTCGSSGGLCLFKLIGTRTVMHRRWPTLPRTHTAHTVRYPGKRQSGRSSSRWKWWRRWLWQRLGLWRWLPWKRSVRAKRHWGTGHGLWCFWQIRK